MKSLKEYLTEVTNLTIEPDTSFWNTSVEGDTLKELAKYAEKIYKVYVKNYGEKCPGNPWTNGNTKGPYEKKICSIVDTNKVDAQCCIFIQFYVFAKLYGASGKETLPIAVGIWNLWIDKMRKMGASHMDNFSHFIDPKTLEATDYAAKFGNVNLASGAAMLPAKSKISKWVRENL